MRYPGKSFPVSDGLLTRYVRSIPVIFLFFVLFICSATAAAAAPVVDISSPSDTVYTRDTFIVSVSIDPDSSSIYGTQFDLSFDKDKLKALSISDGTFLTSDGSSVIRGIETLDNEIGLVTYSITRSGTSIGVTNPGILASVKFEVIQSSGNGTTPIAIKNVILSDPSAEIILDPVIGDEVDIMVYSLPDVDLPVISTTPEIMDTEPVPIPVQPQSSVSEQKHVDLVLSSNSTDICAGDTFEVRIYADPHNTEVYGAEVRLTFNGTMLEFIQVDQGMFLSVAGKGVVVVREVQDAGDGLSEVVYAETLVGQGAASSGGNLATILFRAREPGNTSIMLQYAKMADSNAHLIGNITFDDMDIIIRPEEIVHSENNRNVLIILGAIVLFTLIFKFRRG